MSNQLSPPSSRLSLAPLEADLSELSSELKNSLPESTLIDTDACYLQDASSFLLRLGQVLHAQGTSAMRLEEALGHCAQRLGLQAQIFSTPTSLFVAVGDHRVAQTRMVRVEPSEVNLAKLAELDKLIDSISRGETSLQDGLAQLEVLAHTKPNYHAIFTPIAYGVCSASAACFFQGKTQDIVFSGGLGLALGTLAIWARTHEATRRIFPAIAACIASALALIMSGYYPVSDGVSTVSALIVLIPGLTLTVAMNELATQHWMSGTARFAGAAITFLQMALGVALGREVASHFISTGVPLAGHTAPFWAEIIALMLAPIAFALLFRARPKDIPGIFFTGVLGFIGARLGAGFLGPELGVFSGAFLVATVSNLLARRLKRPSSITLVPGIMLLLPGSIGFRSLSSFLERDVLSGTEGIFRMFLVASTLVGGLLMANVILPPKRDL